MSNLAVHYPADHPTHYPALADGGLTPEIPAWSPSRHLPVPDPAAPSSWLTDGRRDAATAGDEECSRPVAWLPWAQPGTPTTARDEQRFLADLEQHAGGITAPHTRRDLTAVLNALRGGLDVGDLLERAPGVAPDRLYGAYLQLDSLRADACDAWQAIVADGSRAGLLRHGSSAARLVPVAVAELRRSVQHGADAISVEIERVDGRIRQAAELVARFEHELDHCHPSPERARAIGEQLYNPYEASMYFDSWFLPTRVGAIVPTRVAALLGERDLGRFPES